MGLAIDRQVRTILLYSNVIESYPNFKKLLQNNINIDWKKVDNCVDMDNNTQELIKNGGWKFIYDTAEKEWTADKVQEVGKENCSLCNEPNKKICYIKNKFNGNRLNVGSTCVTRYFTDLKDKNGVDVKELFNQQNKLNNEIEFKNNFPNFDSKITEFKNSIDNSGFLVNYHLYYNANQKIEKLKKLRKQYIDQGKANIITEIEELIKDLDLITKHKIPECNKELANNKFACTKSISDWLRIHKKDKVIEQIRKNNSIININTISQIGHKEFVKANLYKFKELSNGVIANITILNEGFNNTPFVYVGFNNFFISEISFYTSISNFMEKLGVTLFLEPNKLKQYYNLSRLLSNVFSLEMVKENVYRLYDILNDVFRSQFEFLFDFSGNTTYIIDRRNKEINKNYFYITKGTNYVVEHILNNFNCRDYNESEKRIEEIKEFCINKIFSNLSWRERVSDNTSEAIKQCRKEMRKYYY